MSGRAGGPFSTRVVVWLVAAASFSLLLAMLFSGFADSLGEPGSAGADSYSWSVLGHRALAEVLARRGHRVVKLRTRHLARVDSTTTVLLAELTIPGPDSLPRWTEHQRWLALHERSAALVVVLPKRTATEDAMHPGWAAGTELLLARAVERAGKDCFDESLTVLRRPSVRETASVDSGAGPRVELTDAQGVLDTEWLEPIVTVDSLVLVAKVKWSRFNTSWDPAPEWVQELQPQDSSATAEDEAYEDEDGKYTQTMDPDLPPVYLVTDPDLLNNGGLGRADHAAWIGAFLDSLPGDAFAFDEVEHGFASEPSLMAELVRPPLVFAFVQALVLAIFLVWSGARRFGKPAAEAAAVNGKRALIDTTAALLAQTGQSWESLRLYHRQTLHAVAEHFLLGPETDVDRLARRLDALSRSRGLSTDVLEWGRTLTAMVGRADDPALVLKAAAEMHHWREEMTHEHR
ncbi:MAG: hypothetical protein HZA61_12305 [Candidatus Eisenbacteria bacterium]|uniref:DUF4350 domain-containing protein n=1 Tax=Eiseniibacteriota bacterium TaxID=2212470 RepID=A0A933W3S7_UNCEI|nr:hypothetical protein [Candidatus Eisenbacteria bacterium]